jgi:hypothetical protein
MEEARQIASRPILKEIPTSKLWQKLNTCLPIQEESEERLKLATMMLKNALKTNPKTSKRVITTEKNANEAKLYWATQTAVVIALKAGVTAEYFLLCNAMEQMREATRALKSCCSFSVSKAMVAVAVAVAKAAAKTAKDATQRVVSFAEVFFEDCFCVENIAKTSSSYHSSRSHVLDCSDKLGMVLSIPEGACSDNCTVTVKEVDPARIEKHIPEEMIACTPACMITMSEELCQDATLQIYHSLASDTCNDVKYLWGSLSVLQVNLQGQLEELPSTSYEVINDSPNRVCFPTSRLGTFVMCVRRMLHVPERVRLLVLGTPASRKVPAAIQMLCLCPDRADCRRRVLAQAKLRLLMGTAVECTSSVPMVVPKVGISHEIEVQVSDEVVDRKATFTWEGSCEDRISFFNFSFGSASSLSISLALEGWPVCSSFVIHSPS